MLDENLDSQYLKHGIGQSVQIDYLSWRKAGNPILRAICQGHVPSTIRATKT